MTDGCRGDGRSGGDGGGADVRVQEPPLQGAPAYAAPTAPTSAGPRASPTASAAASGAAASAPPTAAADVMMINLYTCLHGCMVVASTLVCNCDLSVNKSRLILASWV
jgi:hypothetical protein